MSSRNRKLILRPDRVHKLSKKMTRKIISLTILILTFNFINAQETINARFTHYEGDVAEYLRKGFKEEYRKFFDPNGDFLYSVTLDLLVDETGKVKNVSFIENSSNERFDVYLKRKMMNTSGMWEISKIGNNSNELFHVILPFRLKILPKFTNVDESEINNRSKASKETHSNLSLEIFDRQKYQRSTSIVLDEVFIGVFEPSIN